MSYKYVFIFIHSSQESHERAMTKLVNIRQQTAVYNYEAKKYVRLKSAVLFAEY